MLLESAAVNQPPVTGSNSKQQRKNKPHPVVRLLPFEPSITDLKRLDIQWSLSKDLSSTSIKDSKQYNASVWDYIKRHDSDFNAIYETVFAKKLDVTRLTKSNVDQSANAFDFINSKVDQSAKVLNIINSNIDQSVNGLDVINYSNVDQSAKGLDVRVQRYRFNCSNTAHITVKRKLGHGVTKHVYLGFYKGERVAVKMVTRGVMDVTSCLKEKSLTYVMASLRERERCYVMPNMKLMKEILLLEQISHPNLVQMLGYCVRSEETEATSLAEHGVVAVYEYAESFYVATLSDWTTRLRLETALSLADLLDYLEHSPLGSLRISDFKAAHFLMTSSKEIKLTDLDDVNSLEPICVVSPAPAVGGGHQINRAADAVNTSRENYGVTQKLNESRNYRTTGQQFIVRNCDYDLKCIGGICRGHNAAYNMDRMNRLFFQNLLLYDDGRNKEGVEEEGDRDETDGSDLTEKANEVSRQRLRMSAAVQDGGADAGLSRSTVADNNRSRGSDELSQVRPRSSRGELSQVFTDVRTDLNRRRLTAARLKEIISALFKVPLFAMEIGG